jgi:hypothetical protein
MFADVFQPYDFGLQLVFKQIIRGEANKYFIANVQQQIQDQVVSIDVNLSKRLKELTNQTPSDGYETRCIEILF